MRTPDGVQGGGGSGNGGGGAHIILISSLSVGRNMPGWDLVEGTQSLHVTFLSQIPVCLAAQSEQLRLIPAQILPPFLMPFMKTRSAFNAFL